MRAPLSPATPRSDSGCGNDRWSCWPWSRFHLKQARQLWEDAPFKTSVLVAAIDDGFDLDHPVLRDKLWQTPNRPGARGWDFVNDRSDPWPLPERQLSSHGTMVAGIIGGRSDLVDSFAGVAPNATLMLLRWRSRQPREAHANPAAMANALRFAVEHGAQIVNLSASINAPGKSPQGLAALESAFALAEERGVLVVVAAPNLPNNMDQATDWLPGVYPFTNIIHVTGFCRQLKLLGAWGARSVDIAAPAEDIMGPTVGDGYAAGCATSFAAPLVTGALALVWGLLPKLRADEVRRLLLGNAQPSARIFPETSRVASHEVWGHEPPARPEGLLDLAFLRSACESYWAQPPFTGFDAAGAYQ